MSDKLKNILKKDENDLFNTLQEAGKNMNCFLQKLFCNFDQFVQSVDQGFLNINLKGEKNKDNTNITSVLNKEKVLRNTSNIDNIQIKLENVNEERSELYKVPKIPISNEKISKKKNNSSVIIIEKRISNVDLTETIKHPDTSVKQTTQENRNSKSSSLTEENNEQTEINYRNGIEINHSSLTYTTDSLFSNNSCSRDQTVPNTLMNFTVVLENIDMVPKRTKQSILLTPTTRKVSNSSNSEVKKKVTYFESIPLNRKVQSKLFTPTPIKYLPVDCSSFLTKVVDKNHTPTKYDVILAPKYENSLKASQAEFRQREIKRKAKEKEAWKKREDLLKILTEEKKRKREEKLQEDNKNVDVATKKIKLYNLRENRKRIEVNRETAVRTPVYMRTDAPILPTLDCYDSDEENQHKVFKLQNRLFKWNKTELNKMQMAIASAGEIIKNTFFYRKTRKPDLKLIFERIDPKKLKRTSSVVWKKSPRYTLLGETKSEDFK